MSAYDEAAEKAVKQVITQYFESHPVLSDMSVAEKLAGLLNSDNERIVLGAIKMWSVLRQMKPNDEAEDSTSMEEILRAETQAKEKPKEEPDGDVIYIDDRSLVPLPDGLTPHQQWERICPPGVSAGGDRHVQH